MATLIVETTGPEPCTYRVPELVDEDGNMHKGFGQIEVPYKQTATIRVVGPEAWCKGFKPRNVWAVRARTVVPTTRGCPVVLVLKRPSTG